MAKRIVWLYLVMVLWLPTAAIPAWSQAPPKERWEPLPGRAADLAINSEAQAYAVDKDGNVWRWRPNRQRWGMMARGFSRIAAAGDNRPWAVNADGVVYRYNGLWWENKDKGITDVAANARGEVFIALQKGGLRRWNSLRTSFEPYSEERAIRLAVNDDGTVWMVRSDGSLAVHGQDGIHDLPGRARDIAVSGNTAIIVDTQGRVRRWKAETRNWETVSGLPTIMATAVAVVPGGGIWIALEDGRILANTRIVPEGEEIHEKRLTEKPKAPGISAPPVAVNVPAAPGLISTIPQASTTQAPHIRPEPQAAEPAQAPPLQTRGFAPQPPPAPATVTAGAGPAGAEPETITTSEPITFVDTRQNARQLAIASNGTIFGLNAAGQLLLWDNASRRFDDFPGNFVRIAVTPDGLPWGITSLGRVFRHDGNNWVQVVDAVASDIAIGTDNTVVIADAGGNLFTASASDSFPRFVPVRGSGRDVLVAVAPDGTTWTVNRDGFVQRCDTQPCTLLQQKAQSIGVGPDGSVFVVSQDGRLLRLNQTTNRFERIATPGHTPLAVAVGPRGLPWLTTTRKVVLASAFFAHEDAADSTLALRTKTSQAGSGDTGAVVSNQVSGFTFTKTMGFEEIHHSFPAGTVISLATGADGSVWALSVIGGTREFEKYDPTFKRFRTSTTGLETATVDYMDIATNGDLWASTSDGLFLRARNRKLTDFSPSVPFPSEVVVGPDDTVYVIASAGTLYYKPASSQIFKKFSSDTGIIQVAVGAAGEIWITQGANKTVKQWTGTGFENRPVGSSQKANDIGASPDGDVYIIDDNLALRKWNGTNKSWDEVRNTSYTAVDVDNEGRPWVADTSAPTIKRAVE